MKNILRRLLPLLLLAALIFGGYYGYTYFQTNYADKFACSYQPFTKVQNGMDTAQVVSLLDEPDTKVIKNEMSENRFGQGELELNIKSAWLYELPEWDGSLEIYFDSKEIVVGKNCGHA
jgi:hypothetical protein